MENFTVNITGDVNIILPHRKIPRRVRLKSDTLRKYFPRSYTPQQMEQVIIKLLDQWQKKRQRQNER